MTHLCALCKKKCVWSIYCFPCFCFCALNRAIYGLIIVWAIRRYIAKYNPYSQCDSMQKFYFIHEQIELLSLSLSIYLFIPIDCVVFCFVFFSFFYLHEQRTSNINYFMHKILHNFCMNSKRKIVYHIYTIRYVR